MRRPRSTVRKFKAEIVVEDNQPFLRMDGVAKSYGGIRALEHADLMVRKASIHAILGENGAGKSTLIKIISGVVTPSAGSMQFDGRPVSFSSPAEASRAGVACVFQELSLVPDLSVADNICIANPPRKFGMIDRRAQRRIAEAALARAGASGIHPLGLVKDLPLSARQLVEIAKALASNPRLLILDEATSALTAADVKSVFKVLKQLRSDGLALLYISHRMQEIDELADECTVFRNGRSIARFKAGAHGKDEIVKMMLGREVSSVFPPKPAVIEESRPVAVRCRNVSWSNRLKDISFDIRQGEILGLGGLDGQGQREMQLALFGVLRDVNGTIEVDGKPIAINSPKQARSDRMRMALVPEDRKTEGLMLPMSVRDNLSFAALDRISSNGVIQRDEEQRQHAAMIDLLRIKALDLSLPVSSLSGGNQQKVVIAKWLMRQPRIILMNDPTRGIDVGTKQEIYQLLRRLADEGAAILFYSTDYHELIGCCDRVLVFYDGAIVRQLQGDEITEFNLVSSALNVGEKASAA